MDEVRDQLALLVGEVDVDRLRPTPDELWKRGVRHRRRRRAGSAAILLVAAALVVTLGVSGMVRARPEPRPSEPSAPPIGVPQRFYTPSPWLAGTVDGGLLGPLAATIPSDRKSWFATTPGLVGVSAQTGEYRFLDLPGADLSDLDQATLSSAGTELAYWSGTNLDDGEALVDGVSVYDPVTGAVAHAPIPTVHGLEPDSLSWVDDTTLVIDFAQRVNPPGLNQNVESRFAPELVWRVGLSDPVTLPRSSQNLNFTPGNLGADAAGNITYRYRGCHVVDPRTGRTVGTRSPGCGHDLDPSRRRYAAGVQYAQGVLVLAHRLTITSVAPHATQARYIPHDHYRDAYIAWTDPRHLAIVRGAGHAPFKAILEVVNVDTGVAVVLSRIGHVDITNLASDLLARPSVPATSPPDPIDPRLLTGLIAGLVAAALAALLVWRRCARP